MMKQLLSLIILSFLPFSASPQNNDTLKTRHFHVGILAGVQALRGASFNLVNGSAIDMRGLQFAGVSNVAVHSSGMQFSGLNNIAVKRMHGMQFTAGVNIAGRVDGAFQWGGFANICQTEMRGVQFSLVNMADSVKGAQVGIVNVAGQKVRGMQLGLINSSADTTAMKIGLVNVYPFTRIQLLAFGGNTSKLNVAARFTNRKTYTIAGFGTHYLDLDQKFSGCLYYRVGVYRQLSQKWRLSGDVGYFHIENFKNEDDETPERMYSVQARINAEFRLHKRLSLFASGGYGVTRYYTKNKLYESKPVVELGVVLF